MRFDLIDYQFKWVHITATYEVTNTNSVGKLYIDGDLVAEQNLGEPKNSEIGVYIGSPEAGNLLYSGLMDEIRTWK